MEIERPEKLPFALYHGTSHIWRQSIEERGLGGRKIVEEFRAVECLRATISYFEKLPSNERPDDYALEKYRLLSEQVVDPKGMNFRHDAGVYLTPCRSTALGYARANRFGSEIISECHNICKRYEIDELRRCYHELLSLRSDGAPLLVCVRDVRLSDLVTETGENSFEQLEFLLEQISEARGAAERRQCLCRRVSDRDIDAIGQLLTPDTDFLTEEQIVDCYGQQINFQSSVVYHTSELVFEEVAI